MMNDFKSMDETMRTDGGHVVEGCDGRWINIGTLANPWKQKCGKCRGTRDSRALEATDDTPIGRQQLESQGVQVGIVTLILVALVFAALGGFGALVWVTLR